MAKSRGRKAGILCSSKIHLLEHAVQSVPVTVPALLEMPLAVCIDVLNFYSISI